MQASPSIAAFTATACTAGPISEKALHASHDNAIMLSVIDNSDKIEKFLPLVEQMVVEGLVVLSDVDIIKYAYRAADVER